MVKPEVEKKVQQRIKESGQIKSVIEAICDTITRNNTFESVVDAEHCSGRIDSTATVKLLSKEGGYKTKEVKVKKGGHRQIVEKEKEEINYKVIGHPTGHFNDATVLINQCQFIESAAIDEKGFVKPEKRNDTCNAVITLESGNPVQVYNTTFKLITTEDELAEQKRIQKEKEEKRIKRQEEKEAKKKELAKKATKPATE
jgi:hypothetical protein